MHSHTIPPLCRNFSFSVFSLLRPALFCPALLFPALLFLAWTVALPGACRAADPSGISRTEWAAYLNDAGFRDADQRLNATYRKIMAGLAPQEKQTLLTDQRAWITVRNRDAHARHAKGSPEYIRALTDATARREAELRARHPAASVQTDPGGVPIPPARIEVTVPPARTEAAAQPARTGVTVQPAPDTVPEQPVQDTVAVRPAPDTVPARPGEVSAARVAGSLAVALGPKPKEPTAAQPPKPEETPAAPALPGTPSFVVRPSPPINTTTARFAASYNLLAYSFQAATFPPVPTGVTGGGKTRTEQYAVTDGITIQFKYTNGQFENPEIITFLGHRFMTGSRQQRGEIAHALFALLKTLHLDSRKDERARDTDIVAFVDSLTGAFTADASRIWKYDGLVYVVTYMKKDDLFALTVNADSGPSRAATRDR